MSEAKILARVIWSEHPYTFYCGCKFNSHLIIDYTECGYIPHNSKRAKRVEWEHLVPASWLGKQRACWREQLCESKRGKKFKGRNCCEKIDPAFNKAYLDLYNLVPAIGEVNGARKDYRFGMLGRNEANQYLEGCSMHINDRNHVVEPSEQVKGMIARAHLYMADTHELRLSVKQRKLFTKWDEAHPPSPWELRWAEKVNQVQGNQNNYIERYR
ncbi:MAG: endonuclease [Gammaproteobacteria bacterium]